MPSVAFNPNFTPSAGLNCVLASAATGTPSLPGTDWTIALDSKHKDCSNFSTGRLKVGTLLDGDLDFTLVWDAANEPVSGGSNPTGYYVGNYVTVYCFTDLSNLKYFKFSGLLTKISPAIASIEDAMMYKVTVTMSSVPPSVTFTQQPQFVYPT